MASPLAQAYLQSVGAATPQQPFRSQIAPTDVERAYSDYNNSMMQAYAAQLGQQNAMWGGLAGLGGAAVTALPKMMGGSSLSSLLGGAGSSVDLAGIPDALASGIAPEDLLASLALV